MKFFDRFLDLCARRTRVVLCALLAVTVLSGLLARRVRVDARLEALLGSNSEALRAMDAMENLGPHGTPLQIVVTSPDADTNRAVVSELALAVGRWPDARWAIARRDLGALSEKLALFLPGDVLESWADAVEDRVSWEQCDRVPLCVNFETRPDVPEQEDVADAFDSVPEFAALKRFGVAGDVSRHSVRTAVAASAVAGAGWLCNRDSAVCAVDASINASARDVRASAAVLRRVETLAAQVAAAHPTRGLRIEASGPFRNAALNERVASADLRGISMLSAVLVGLLLLALFRSARLVVAVVVPTLVAAVWTLGLLGAARVELNLIASFSFAILIGLGVDFGIHIVTHYQEARQRGLAAHPALTHTFHELGPSLTMAATTTASAFFALLAASFRGFSQMGWVAALGVAVSLLAFVTWCPALLMALDGRAATSARHRETAASERRRVGGARVAIVALGVGLGVAGVCSLPALQLEGDLRRLQPDGVAHAIPTREAMRGTQGVSIHLYSTDPTQLREATRDTEASLHDAFAAGASVLALGPSTFVPAEQGRGLAALGRMREALETLPSAPDAGEPVELGGLRAMVSATTELDERDLPPFVRDLLLDAQGRFGRVSLVVLGASGSDAHDMARLSDLLDAVRARHPGVTIASPAALLGEILPGLARDGPRVVLLAMLGLALGTWLGSRRLDVLGYVLASVALTAAITCLLLVAGGTRLNLFNMAIIPAAFGLAVDAAVYVTWSRIGPLARQWRGVDEEHRQASANRRAILGSTLTTFAAFACLALSAHPGVASIGRVGAISIAVSATVSLVWLAALLEVTRAPPRAHTGDVPSGGTPERHE